MTRLRVEISKLEVSSRLIDLFTISGDYGMLEAKYYQCIDMFFPFIFGYWARTLRILRTPS